MTNTAAPRQTAREQIAAVAAESGWTADVSTATTLRIQRGEIRIVVAYKRDGAVRWAERRRPSTPELDRPRPGDDVWIVRDSIAAEDSGKRETVIAWLTAEGGEGSEQATEPAPAAQTAREQIAAVAAENGWAMYATTDRAAAFVRGSQEVSAIYTEPGAVRSATRLTAAEDGRSKDVAGPHGRRETVIAWLSEADAQRTYRCELCGETVATVDQPQHMDERHTPAVEQAPEQTATDILAERDDVEFDARYLSERDHDVTAVELGDSGRLVGWVDQQARLLTALSDSDPVIVPVRLVDAYVDAIAARPGTERICADERNAIALALIEQAKRDVAEPDTQFDRKTATADQLRARATELHEQADALPVEGRNAARARSAMLRSEARELVQLADHLDADLAPSRGLGELAMTREMGSAGDEPFAQHKRAPLCPHGHGALRWADDAWICPKCGDEWSEDTVNEPADLDAAERDGAAGSLERLADMALYPGQNADKSRAHVQSLVGDHVAIVRARIAELEAELAATRTEAEDYAARARSVIAELEGEREQARRRVTELEAQPRPPITMRALLAEAQARIAELEARDAAAQEMLSRAVTIERERDEVQAQVRSSQRAYDNLVLSWSRDQDRIAELESARVAAERELSEAQARNASLTAERDYARVQVENWRNAFRAVDGQLRQGRSRIEELETIARHAEQLAASRHERIAELETARVAAEPETELVDQAWRDHLDVTGDPQD